MNCIVGILHFPSPPAAQIEAFIESWTPLVIPTVVSNGSISPQFAFITYFLFTHNFVI